MQHVLFFVFSVVSMRFGVCSSMVMRGPQRDGARFLQLSGSVKYMCLKHARQAACPSTTYVRTAESTLIHSACVHHLFESRCVGFVGM